jgi:glycerophosphoryl diester phosphodiesterase
MSLDIVSAVKRGFLNIAHRGARSLAPENTLAAARKALSLGAHMWEIDVRLSRDGCPVVIHDATLDRTSDAPIKFPERKPWYVHDFTLSEMQSLDFGSWFNRVDPFGQIAANTVTLAEQAQYRGERILTLENAIRFTVSNDWLMNIEIKDFLLEDLQIEDHELKNPRIRDLSEFSGYENIVEKVVDLVVSLHAGEKILISSFNHDYLRQVKKLDGKIQTGVLVEHFQRNCMELMLALDAVTFHPGWCAIRPRQIRKLKKSGFGVLVWVVNNRKLASLLLRSGIDGVITDFPQKIR